MGFQGLARVRVFFVVFGVWDSGLGTKDCHMPRPSVGVTIKPLEKTASILNILLLPFILTVAIPYTRTTRPNRAVAGASAVIWRPIITYRYAPCRMLLATTIYTLIWEAAEKALPEGGRITCAPRGPAFSGRYKSKACQTPSETMKIGKLQEIALALCVLW